MTPFDKVLAFAFNDLRLTLRDRASVFWLLAFPLAFMWFFGQIGGGSNATPKISLHVENRDAGWLGASFVEELQDETVQLELVEPSEAESYEGRSRTLVIPETFTEGVLAGEPQALQLITEKGTNERFSIAAQAHLARVTARTLARLVEIESFLKEGGRPGPESFAALAGRSDLVTVEVSSAGRGRPIPSEFSQSVPGTLTFTVLMMTLIYGAIFLATERQTGMLRRQASLPVTRRQIFLGKLLGRLVIAGVQVIVLVLAGKFLFGVDWGASPVGLALVLATYTMAVAALATLLGALVRTPEQASGIGWITGMVMGALGGCWWPSEVMPRWLWTIAHALPTAWAMDAFHALVSFGEGAGAVLFPCLVLLGFAAFFAGLGARYLRPT